MFFVGVSSARVVCLLYRRYTSLGNCVVVSVAKETKQPTERMSTTVYMPRKYTGTRKRRSEAKLVLGNMT